MANLLTKKHIFGAKYQKIGASSPFTIGLNSLLAALQ